MPNPLTKSSVVECPSRWTQPATETDTHLALTTNDRLVFLAVQKTALGATSVALGLITRLEWDELQSSIAALQSQGLIAKATGAGSSYYATSSLPTEPLHARWENLLRKFWKLYPPNIEGDTLGTTYASCGVVLLTAMISGSSDERRIAQVTTFPLKFVRLVLQMAERANLWMCESAYELRRILQIQPVNFPGLEASLLDATEDFWELAWTPDVHSMLPKYRSGHQVAGKVDWWTDKE
jgi:hypothetical protein